MVYFLCKAYDSDRQNCYFAQSLPVRGAWIEISMVTGKSASTWSLPVRGAWIEMLQSHHLTRRGKRRSPCGERGLKFLGHKALACDVPRRSPCGERGLKSYVRREAIELVESLPVRGAWIEIDAVPQLFRFRRVAPRAGSVD